MNKLSAAHLPKCSVEKSANFQGIVVPVVINGVNLVKVVMEQFFSDPNWT
jgi:hypothetical protein